MAKISVCRFLDSAVHIVTFWRKTYRGDLSGGGEHWTRGDLKLLQLFGNWYAAVTAGLCHHMVDLMEGDGPDTNTRDKSRSTIGALVKKRSAVGSRSAAARHTLGGLWWDFNTFGEAYCCRCQRKHHRLHYLRGRTVMDCLICRMSIKWEWESECLVFFRIA